MNEKETEWLDCLWSNGELIEVTKNDKVLKKEDYPEWIPKVNFQADLPKNVSIESEGIVIWDEEKEK